jgi:hypothetical protein
MSIDPDNLEESLSHTRHELRSPMNAIQGYASIMLEEAQKNGHVDYEASLRKILSSTQHMLNLISLMLGRPAETRPSGSVGFDISELISQIEQMFYGVFPGRPLSTERDLDENTIWVSGDENEIADIVTSLLIKTADCSNGRLVFRVGRQTTDTYRVTINADASTSTIEGDETSDLVRRVDQFGAGGLKISYPEGGIHLEMDLILPEEGETPTVPPSSSEVQTTGDFSQLSLPVRIWSALNDAAAMHSVTDLRKHLHKLESLGPEYQGLSSHLHKRCKDV